MSDDLARTLAQEWGGNLRRRRTARRLSQAELALLAERDQSWVSRHERGQAAFSVEAMVRIATALGEEPAHLFPWPARAVTSKEG